MAEARTIPHYAYFRALPWCEPLFGDATFQIRHNHNRDPKPDTEDSFFAETVKTPLTVHAALTFAALPSNTSALPVHEVRALFALGSGLNGHAHIAHGGFLVCLFDEAMALLLSYNKDLQAPGTPRPGTSTAYMNVTYLQHVKTPQDVMVRAWIHNVSGRKYFINATLEDSSGHALTKAEALWVSTAPIAVKSKL